MTKKEFLKIKKALNMTYKEMAKALLYSERTIQGWGLGKTIGKRSEAMILDLVKKRGVKNGLTKP